jgi:formylmethanofuran dehydrogenase subunit E
MNNPPLPELLIKSANIHRHLCPRQVIGVRMGLTAGELLQVDVPQSGKKLYTIAETDGCATDGISVATNCWIGRRTLWVEDFGKVAATFVNRLTGEAIRLVPRKGCRQQALHYAQQASNRWEAQLLGYQCMPLDELFYVQQVELRKPLEHWISRPNRKVICDCCAEEIINDREICDQGMTFCQACAGKAYYHPLASDPIVIETEAPIPKVDER